MYVNKNFEMQDRSEQIDFMRRYSFATIVSQIDNTIVASHLPLVIDEIEGNIRLSGHLAKANTQGAHLDKQLCLVIFTEPHAYISPSHYDSMTAVPTWDYVAIHVYGTCVVQHELSTKWMQMDKMIDFYEPNYKAQWTSLGTEYKQRMLSAVTAFEIEVRVIQGQKKLSQNRTFVEKQRIIESLSNSSISTEREIARLIEREL